MLPATRLPVVDIVDIVAGPFLKYCVVVIIVLLRIQQVAKSKQHEEPLFSPSLTPAQTRRKER
jgi:hypothetical protein